MFILPAFNQRLVGPGLGHNTRHVYVGNGIGDVVRPLISAGAKAAARLAAKGLAAARNLGVDLFHAAKPLAMRAATEAAEVGKDVLRQRAQDLFVPRAGATRNLGVQAAKPRLRQAQRGVAEAGKSILRQRAQDLLAPAVPAAARASATRKPRGRQRATKQQRAQDLLVPAAQARTNSRAGPRKRQRATIQQKARQLLSGRAAKNLDTLIWGQGLRLSPY